MVSAGVSSLSLTSIESLAVDYHGLSQLTFVHSDSSSISQLKRISRDIFDHLAEHLGMYFDVTSIHSKCLSNSDILISTFLPSFGSCKRHFCSSWDHRALWL